MTLARYLVIAIAVTTGALALATPSSPQALKPSSPASVWYKGQLHTHTLNSDGDSTPDDVVRWYREHGHNFVVITDHNYLTSVDGLNALHGADDKFLVIKGEEVTDRFGDKPIQVNVLEPAGFITPPGGLRVRPMAQNMTDAITSARRGPRINHPNY